MGFIKNMRIGPKLILLLVISLAASALIGVIGMFNLWRLNAMQDDMYQAVILPMGYLTDYDNAYGNIRSLLRDYAYESDASTFNDYDRELNDNYAIIQDSVNKLVDYLTICEIDPNAPDSNYEHVMALSDAMPSLSEVINEIALSARNTDNIDATMSLIKSLLVPLTNQIQPQLEELIEHNIHAADENNNNGTATFNQSILICILTLAGSAFLLLLMASVIITAITRPVRHMVDAAQHVARGELNVNLRANTKDEIGLLEQSIASLVATIQRLTEDVNTLSRKHDEGDTDAVMDVAAYEGVYGELALGLNNMLGAYVAGTDEILHCLDGFGRGDFHAKLRAFPGKKAHINTSVEALRDNLNAVSGELRSLVKAALEGQLSTRADADRYEGDWAQLVTGLNNVLNAIAQPLTEASDVMDRLSQGDFSRTMTGDYKGDFAAIKRALNTTVANISLYIKEITTVLTELADNNLDLVVTRDYVGDFSAIKAAMNRIIDKLNDVMEDISTASQQVAAGAKQISESSMTLAEGATEQASSVEELTATVTQINEKTALNAENANKAESLAMAAQENASVGNREMRDMLDSMDNIRTASSNIAKIIKVIDDIALQTNLLALNASVEAARAGQHGKGFTVVADEVRSLASKSKEAAQQTTELIEDSIEKVNQGTRIAKNTAESLERIINDVAQASGIITGIAAASNEQATAISQINTGANQIAEVVQRNSATSEESAAASEELSSQSELLRNMIAIFKLRTAVNKAQAQAQIQAAGEARAQTQAAGEAPAQIRAAGEARAQTQAASEARAQTQAASEARTVHSVPAASKIQPVKTTGTASTATGTARTANTTRTASDKSKTVTSGTANKSVLADKPVPAKVPTKVPTDIYAMPETPGGLYTMDQSASPLKKTEPITRTEPVKRAAATTHTASRGEKPTPTTVKTATVAAAAAAPKASSVGSGVTATATTAAKPLEKPAVKPVAKPAAKPVAKPAAMPSTPLKSPSLQKPTTATAATTKPATVVAPTAKPAAIVTPTAKPKPTATSTPTPIPTTVTKPVSTSATKPAPMQRPTPNPAPRSAATGKSKSGADAFTPATPNASQRAVAAPSGAHEYEKKDFGKY